MSSCGGFKDPDIVGWGDSMMKGSGADNSVLEVLSKELNLVYKNFGIGGLRSSSIALLQGGKPFRIVLKNQEIEARSTSELVHYEIEPINFQTNQTREGAIDEIQGFIERQALEDDKKTTTGYSFTASDLKENVKVKDTVIFTFNDAIAHKNTWTIIWSGRNDKKQGDAIYQTRDNIQSMLDYLDPNAREHVLILSICNGIADREYKGSTAHTNITRLNKLLSETFKEDFIDLRTYMVKEAIHDMGIEPSVQDIADIEKDCMPRRFLKDHVHLNDLGNEIAGKYLAKVIQEKGWTLTE